MSNTERVDKIIERLKVIIQTGERRDTDWEDIMCELVSLQFEAERLEAEKESAYKQLLYGIYKAQVDKKSAAGATLEAEASEIFLDWKTQKVRVKNIEDYKILAYRLTKGVL